MKTALILLAFLSFTVLAEQPDSDKMVVKLLKSLADNDFDARATACAELSDLPAEYAGKLLKMSKTTSMETSSWLKEASKNIFLKRILPKDERYRRLFGMVGMELKEESRYTYDGYERRHGNGEEDTPEPFGYRIEITFPLSEADRILRKWDLIVRVDGKHACDFFRHGPHVDFGFFKAGDVHEFEIWRYKNPDKIYERGFVKEEEDEHEVIKVKVKVEVKEPQFVNLDKLYWLKERAWREFQMVQDDESGLKK